MKEFREKFSELYSEETQKRKNESVKIVANADYMLWLEKFTQIHSYFTDDSWLYDHSEIGNTNYSNVIKLGYLFYAIENYTNHNCIAPSLDGYNPYYIISFNNTCFAIGIIMGTIFYCKRKKDSWDAIPFDDIISDLKATNS